MTQQTQLTEDAKADALQLTTRLRSDDQAIRREAEAVAFSGGSESIELLIEIAQLENAKKPLRFAIAVGLVIAAMTLISIGISLLLHFRIGAGVTGAYAAAFVTAAAYAPTQLQKRVTKALSEIDDPRAIGPLIEALDKQDRSTTRAAAAALIRLLPRLCQEDAEALSDHKRAILYASIVGGVRDLDRALEIQLATAGLTALAAIGDSRLLPHVRKLAAGRGLGRNHPEIRRLAEEIVQKLEDRLRTERLRENLLRPATSAPEQSLLRAAAGRTESDESKLLRASSEDSLDIPASPR